MQKPNISFARNNKASSSQIRRWVLTYQCINIKNHTSKSNSTLGTFSKICLGSFWFSKTYLVSSKAVNCHRKENKEFSATRWFDNKLQITVGKKRVSGPPLFASSLDNINFLPNFLFVKKSFFLFLLLLLLLLLSLFGSQLYLRAIDSGKSERY